MDLKNDAQEKLVDFRVALDWDKEPNGGGLRKSTHVNQQHAGQVTFLDGSL